MTFGAMLQMTFGFLKLKIYSDTEACCVGSLLSIARLFSNMQLGII